MPVIPDTAAFQNSLVGLPLVTYDPQEGQCAVVKEDTEIATVAEPGAIFGELLVLLDQPHTADVRALETSEFHVEDATALLVIGLAAGGKDFAIVTNMCAKYSLDPRNAS